MEKIFEFVKHNNVQNIEVCFVDLFGKSRIITIPKSRLMHALKNGLSFDGSSINGQNNVENSDMKLTLDKNSFYFLPNQNMLVFANTSYKFDSRAKLQKLEKKLLKRNLNVFVGAELEFFLFEKSKIKIKNLENFNLNIADAIDCFFKRDNNISHVEHLYKTSESYDNTFFDNLSYFEHDDGIAFEMLNELVSFCNEKNIDIEAFHHECGTNQFELDFVFDSPSKTSDKIIYLKRLISIFAKQKNLVPCFLPKPIKNHSGSGMHINISVFKDKKNLFFEKSNNQKLSDFAYKFAGGIFKHISSICYFANPLKNSYDRLNSGFETPTKIKLSAIDRSALIRVPKSSYQNTRLELRSPDISCNPYLTILAVLISGFDALKVFYTKHGIKSVDINNTSNIYSSFENFNKQWKNSTLPKSIEEAKASFSKDKLLKNIFPKYKLTLN